MRNTFRCTPVKDKDGRIDIDITEIYNMDNIEERYPAACNQWRIGEIIKAEDILFNENKVAFNKLITYLQYKSKQIKKYILIRFDRYEVAKSEVINFNSYEHNLGLAFKEALINLWEFEEGTEINTNEIKGYGDKLGIDFEEESYLFFEDKIKLENIK